MADLNHIAPLFYQDRAKSRKMLPPYTYICQSKSFTDKSIFFCAIPILFLSPFLFSALFSFFLPSSSPSNQHPPPLYPSSWRFFHPPLHFFAKINFPTSRQHKNFFPPPAPPFFPPLSPPPTHSGKIPLLLRFLPQCLLLFFHAMLPHRQAQRSKERIPLFPSGNV